MTLYEDESLVQQVTDEAIKATGSRILQIDRLDEDDITHASLMLDYFKPSFASNFLDLACGLGQIASTFKQTRPDLSITLNNISAYQLSLCPPFPKNHASAEATQLPSQNFDSIMLNYAIGHFNLLEFIEELDRLLTPNGEFFLYDLFPTSVENGLHLIGYESVDFLQLVKDLSIKGINLVSVRKVLRTDPEWHSKVGITPEMLHNTETIMAVFKRGEA